MKKCDLDKFIGKKVSITLFDNDVITGELHKSGEDMFIHDENLYIPKNYYFCINPQSCLFKCSHVKKIKEANK